MSTQYFPELEAYVQIMEDPNFRASVAYDLELAGGLGRVTPDQLADALLPPIIHPDSVAGGVTDSAFLPPIRGWIDGVTAGYHDLNIPPSRNHEHRTVFDYLTDLTKLSGKDYYRTTGREPTETAVPLGDQEQAIVELGRTTVRQVIFESSRPSADSTKPRVFRSKRASELVAPPTDDKVRIEHATIIDERELNTASGTDRVRFVRYLAINFGYRTKRREITDIDPIEDDPVVDMGFKIHKENLNGTSLPRAIYKSSRTIETARVEFDANMSEIVLELVARRMSLGKGNQRNEEGHQRFDEDVMDRLAEIFRKLDPSLFENPSRNLRKIQAVLKRRVEIGQISEQQMDEFLGEFISPEMRSV